MKVNFFASTNPIMSVSFKHADEETIPAMQRTLAWQWTLDRVDYKKVRAVLSKESTFVIPDDKVARLVVIPQLVHNGQTFDPETDSMVVRKEGKLKGCYMAALKSVNVLPDPDLAAEFIIRLSQVEELWEMAESGKQLPETEPAPGSKAKADKDKDAKPAKKPDPLKDEPAADADADKSEPKAEKAEGKDDSLISLWGSLNGDALARRLTAMSFGAREQLGRLLYEEHAENVSEADKFVAGVKDRVSYEASIVRYLITAIVDVSGQNSGLGELLEKLAPQKIVINSRSDGKGNGDGQKITIKTRPDGQKQRGGQKPKGTGNNNGDQKPKPQPKQQGQPTGDGNNTEANYIRRQLRKVKRQIARAEQEGASAQVIDLLDDMLSALEEGDAKEYNALKAQYDKLISGEEDTDNPGSDEGTGTDDGSGDGTDGATSDDSGDDADAGNDSDGDGEPQGEPDPEDEGYTIADILATLVLAGYTDIPKPFKIMAKGKYVTAASANAVLKQYGIDLMLE